MGPARDCGGSKGAKYNLRGDAEVFSLDGAPEHAGTVRGYPGRVFWEPNPGKRGQAAPGIAALDFAAADFVRHLCVANVDCGSDFQFTVASQPFWAPGSYARTSHFVKLDW